MGLNPFEFRAGIYFLMQLYLAPPHAVLIPLNSGLVFTSIAERNRLDKLVLIPLNSGLVFTFVGCHDIAFSEVLIPLNSGLVFTSLKPA